MLVRACPPSPAALLLHSAWSTLAGAELKASALNVALGLKKFVSVQYSDGPKIMKFGSGSPHLLGCLEVEVVGFGWLWELWDGELPPKPRAGSSWLGAWGPSGAIGVLPKLTGSGGCFRPAKITKIT